MKNLLYKELKLAIHPTTPIFLLLSAMLLIPNYPYLVIFFYMALGVFFICLSGRENHDIDYSMTLPIRKKDIVKARFLFVGLLEMLQLLIAVPFIALRQSFGTANEAGMDANITLLGYAFVLLGVFNYVFFTYYYRHPDKVGTAFIWSNVFLWPLIILEVGTSIAVPFVRDCLDTPDPQFLSAKLLVLAIGILLYIGLTLLAYRRSVTTFNKLDL